jgi:hypothetical protein
MSLYFIFNGYEACMSLFLFFLDLQAHAGFMSLYFIFNGNEALLILLE